MSLEFGQLLLVELEQLLLLKPLEVHFLIGDRLLNGSCLLANPLVAREFVGVVDGLKVRLHTHHASLISWTRWSLRLKFDEGGDGVLEDEVRLEVVIQHTRTHWGVDINLRRNLRFLRRP